MPAESIGVDIGHIVADSIDMASFLLSPVARVVLAVLMTVAAVAPVARGSVPRTVQEQNADDDREVEDAAAPSVRQAQRSNRTAARVHALRGAVRRNAPAPFSLTGRNPFADPLGSRLRC